MKSVLQDWVMCLGLRHQGVILGAIRGCDTVNKSHPSKAIVRAIRCEVLNSHCGDPKKTVSYIQYFEREELWDLFQVFYKNADELPFHYVLHLLHAVEVIGYYHPDVYRGGYWTMFYMQLCRRMHINPETLEQLDSRLNASEDDFKEAQDGAE